MLKIKISDIKAKSTKFQMNGIEVKIKVTIIEETNYYFLIGLFNPNNKKFKYDNYFTKVGIIDAKDPDYVIIANKKIENPPYCFYYKFIKDESNSLDAFYIKFVESLFRNRAVNFKTSPNRNEKIEGFYFSCFVDVSDRNISTKQMDKIKRMYGQSILNLCIKHQKTIRFTDDETEAKILRAKDIN